jgi:hypothetical protein
MCRPIVEFHLSLLRTRRFPKILVLEPGQGIPRPLHHISTSQTSDPGHQIRGLAHLLGQENPLKLPNKKPRDGVWIVRLPGTAARDKTRSRREISWQVTEIFSRQEVRPNDNPLLPKNQIPPAVFEAEH